MKSAQKEPSAFSKKVIALIKKIPRGQVATYGQIARLAGNPHAARGVRPTRALTLFKRTS